MKKYFVLLGLMLFLNYQLVTAQEHIYINELQVPHGSQTIMKIGFQFDEGHDYVSYQFTIELPDGLSLVTNEYGKVPVMLGDGQPSSLFTLDMNTSSHIVTCYSNPSTPIAENTGVLVSIPIRVEDNLADRTLLNGKLTGIQFAHSDATPENFSDASFSISVTNTVQLDENSTEAPWNAPNVNVRVLRTISDNSWNTICLPFAMTEAQVKVAFGADVELGDFNDYEYDDAADALKVKFKSVSAIEANHPYIIKVSEPVTEFTIDGVDLDPQNAVVDFDTSRRKNQPRQFVGTYVADTKLEWGTLFLNGNQFWYSTGLTKMKGFRGYFNFYDLLADFEENYESRIAMTFDETTGISTIHNPQFIMHNDVYDLSGRKISGKSVQRGLYIKNGKCIVVK